MKILVLLRGLPQPNDEAPARDAPLGHHERAALEQAVTLRQRTGDATQITALCAGPPEMEPVLLNAARRGADTLVRLWDERLASVDCLGVSRSLAAAARHLGFDLMLAGHAAPDGGLRCVGPAVAEGLDIPHLTGVHRLDRSDTHPTALRVERFHNGRLYAHVMPLPCLLTVLSSDPTSSAPGEAPSAGEAPAPGEAPAAPAEIPSITSLGLSSLGIDPAVLEGRIPAAPRPRPDSPPVYETAWVEDAATVAEHLADLGLLPR